MKVWIIATSALLPHPLDSGQIGGLETSATKEAAYLSLAVTLLTALMMSPTLSEEII